MIASGSVASAATFEGPNDGLVQVRTHLDAASAALAAGDIATARAEYDEFDEGWDRVEDGVINQSRASYRAIEDAMTAVVVALAPEPLDPAVAAAALDALAQQVDRFLAGDLSGAALASAA